ncbi:MAG: arylsulfatase regulator [Deltaproteobacteria bacterium]
MSLSDEQLNIAAQIDARVRKLERADKNAVTIFVEMSTLMPSFKQLMDTAGHSGMDELCSRFDGLYRYAKILENIAEGIQSGEIKVPRMA